MSVNKNIVFKNIIIISLIILIFYFIIKNKIIEKNNFIFFNDDNKKKVTFNDVNEVIPTKINSPVDNTMGNISNDLTNVQDLYDFVFEDNEASGNLEKYYDEPEVKSRCLKNEDTNVECRVGEFDNVDKPRELCSNSITKHHELLQKKNIIKNNNIPQKFQSENIAEYDNESIMNGAPILGDITGFDTFNTDYGLL